MSVRADLRTYIQTLGFFDTHSHVAGFDEGTPVDDRAGRSLPQIIMNDYLLYLAGSVGGGGHRPGGGVWSADEADDHWRTMAPLLDEYRALSTWAALREGVRALHPFDGPDITDANWRSINDAVLHAYRTHGERAWHRRACAHAGIVKQNQMVTLPYVTDHWDALPSDERAAQRELLLPSLVLDGYLFTGFDSAAPGRRRSMELLGVEPRTHGEYIDFLARVLDLFVERGGASVKLLTAYHRPLRFEEIDDAEAADLFARGPGTLDDDALRRLQDNLCWRLLELAVERGLPLIVHTGYAVPTSFGNPEDLLNILRSPRLRGLHVDLSHAGWPRAGGAMILARTFPGAYFNLCWTPLLSPALGRRLLGEAIDMIPRSKILLGTDCGSAESMVGTVALIRDMLADVLAERVDAGAFPLAVARDTARALMERNGPAFYGRRLD